MEFDVDDIEYWMKEYINLGSQIDILQERRYAVRQRYLKWLEQSDSKKVLTEHYIAKKCKRRGNVDVKKIQSAFNISDEEIDTMYRRDPVEMWVVKKR